MHVALDTPMPASRISFAGPGKTPAELRQAIAAGVTIEMESPTEAARIADLGERLGIRPRVAIRVNPDFALKGSGMRMGGGPQQFGVDAERVPALIADLADTDLDLLGFHIFAGSQNLNAELLCEAQRKTVELALRLAERRPGPSATSTSAAASASRTSRRTSRSTSRRSARTSHGLIADAIGPNLPEARVVIELGRYIVGEAGVYVTRVVDRKESRGKTFLVVDGGLHHQLAASGNFGQVIRRNYPVAIAGRTTPARDRDRQRRRLPLHAARPARLRHGAAAGRTSATSSSSSRPAPTG